MQTQTVQTRNLGALQIGIIVLTLITASVHFTLLFPDPVFILNSLGYLTLLAAYFLPVPIAKDNRRLVRWIYMGFIVVTILAWVAIGDKSWPAGALGYFTKIVELVLLALLWNDRRY